MKPTETKTSFQHVDDDGWATLTDKLTGLEIDVHGTTCERENGVDVCTTTSASHVIPVDYVPALIRKLIAFAANGNIAIAHAAYVEATKKNAT